jgi:phage terminase small subunit
MLMALTGKKLLFANAVLAGSSNGEAAITAGYSAKTAPQAGSRLVKDQAVVAYLAARRKAATESPADSGAPMTPAFDINAALMHSDPMQFLTVAMNDPALDAKMRIDAAKALMPFKHAKLGEGGKKEQKDAAAKKVAGRFAAAAPPKLVAAGGRKV